jgi:hypothetical protein
MGIRSKPANDAYRKGWEATFKKAGVLENNEEAPVFYCDEIVINQSRSKDTRNKRPFWRKNAAKIS